MPHALLSTQPKQERGGRSFPPGVAADALSLSPCEPCAESKCGTDQQLDLLCDVNEYAHDLQIMADSLGCYR